LSVLAAGVPKDEGVPWSTIAVFAVVVVCLFVLALVGRVFSLWLQAFMSRANVTLSELIGMRFRKVDARMIVLQKIRAVSADVSVTTEDLVRHSLAGGRVDLVVSAVIAAQRAGVEMSFQKACDIDLAGHDVVNTVQQMTSSVASL
jgi:uncharacterized protein YqfA (UPF0365 family)